MLGPSSGERPHRNWIPLFVIGVVVVLVAAVGISRYNALVSKREGVDNAWAQVQNVLQRRADLIPNLVATVKGYASHETEVLEHLADARAKLAGARTPEQATAATAATDAALSRLLVVVENYPNLKADQSFIRLQDELAGTENRIAVERMRYNEVVRDYNQTIKRFPSSLFAGMFGFTARQYFQANANAQQVPQVKF